jgi:hypothetical protein
VRGHRFDVLLAVLVLLLLCTPLAGFFIPRSHPFILHVTVQVIYAGTLFTAVVAVAERRSEVITALSLALPAMILQWFTLAFDREGLFAASYVFGLVFLAYTVALILRYIFAVEKVTFQVICAALCVYLLLGLMWSQVYSLIDVVEPGSFAFSHVGEGKRQAMHFGTENTMYPVYYSFVTLTTLGYGDIVPLTPAARMFAVVEAIVGQLYLAVLVARLVGLHITTRASGKR